MSDTWYYQIFGESFGPVAEGEINMLISIGTLSADDLVSTDGQANWLQISAAEAFRRQLADSLEYADSFDDFVIDFDSEKNESTQNSSELVAQVAASVKDDAPQSNQSATAPAAATPIQPANSFEVRLHADSSEFYSLDAVRSLILVGAINAMTPIRKSASDPWSTVRELLPDEYRKFAKQGGPRRPSRKQAPANRRRRSGKPSLHAQRLEEIRRREQESEEILDEIFDELESRPAPAAVPTPVADPTPQPVQQPVTSTAYQPQTATVPVPAAAAATLTAFSAPAPMSTPVRSSPLRLKKKRQPLQLPEGRTLAFAGGGTTLAGLVLAFCMGWIALPFGTFGGALDGDRGVVVHCFLEYRNLAGMPDQVEWDHFVNMINSDVKPIAESSEGSESPVAKAAALLIEIASSDPVADRQKIAAAGQKLSPLVGEIAGS